MTIPESPCNKCLQKDVCSGVCTTWKEWFTICWKELQNRYLGKEPE